MTDRLDFAQIEDRRQAEDCWHPSDDEPEARRHGLIVGIGNALMFTVGVGLIIYVVVAAFLP